MMQHQVGDVLDGDGGGACGPLSPALSRPCLAHSPTMDGSPSGGSPALGAGQGRRPRRRGVRGGVAVLRVRPGPGDGVPVPAQQRGRRDQEPAPTIPAEQPGPHGPHGAIRQRAPRLGAPDDAARPDGDAAPRSRPPLVLRRAEPEEVKEAADEQEGDRAAHADELAGPADERVWRRASTQANGWEEPLATLTDGVYHHRSRPVRSLIQVR